MDLAPPVSWQLLGGALIVLFITTGIFLSLTRYSRVAQAPGVVESSRGIVSVTADRRGTATKVLVREGDRVRAGQPLLVIDHGSTTSDGTLQDLRARATREEADALAARAPAMRRASAARVSSYRNDLAAARSDQAQIASQIAQEAALVAAAREDLERARQVAVDGFISRNDIRRREETLASRVQERSRLEQQLQSARAAEGNAGQRIAQEQADLNAALGEIAGQRASLRGRGAADDNVRSTIVRAAADGVIADMAVVEGQPLGDGERAMTLIPTGGSLRVRLRLPPDAAASVAPGQTATIAIEAFPYQTYGTLPARLTRVSESAVGEGEAKGFVAYAELARPWVRAYGVQRPVRPGMTVTARIKTMDRTLAQWLLDPLYAVATR